MYSSNIMPIDGSLAGGVGLQSAGMDGGSGGAAYQTTATAPRDLVRCIDDTKQQNASTILIQNQDHTLGNVVRYQLLRDARVRFAGYKKPHPLEEKIEVKVYTDGTVKPEEAVRDSCTKLNDELDKLATEFRSELHKFVGEDGIGMPMGIN